MNKLSKSTAILIVVLIVLSMKPIPILECPDQYAISQVENSEKVLANEFHVPIDVDGNANFSAIALTEGWDGIGSVEDPYIIDSYDFTLGPTSTSCINISNTQFHFIIRNCNFEGPLATPSYGIYLDNVTNAQLCNNMATGFSNAIFISSSSSKIIISGNNCSYNSYGIDIHDSNETVVMDNYCNSNFFHGISMDTCESSSVIDNTCNTNSMSAIYIYNCTSITVTSNTCFDNDFGIHLMEQGSHNVTWNFCANNTDSGIDLFNCDSNTIANNTSMDNSLFGVTIHNSADYNSILWNALIGNGWQDGYDQDIGNIFSHNYYSEYGGSDADQDYIGDSSHTFNFNSDSFPLMCVPFAPEWIVTPRDQTLEYGDTFLYSFQFSMIEPSAPYELQVNDTANFSTFDDTLAQNRHVLPVGDYPLEVNTTNVYGYYTKGTFTLAVRDTIPPTITHPDDITVMVNDEGPQLEWTLSDLSPLTYALLRNGTEISSTSASKTDIYFSTSIETHSPGVYNYTMMGVDIWGNVVADVVIVTVLPIPFLDAMLPRLVVSAVGIAAVVVLVIAFRIRRK
jgi:parallel beta-helix repeat protein